MGIPVKLQPFLLNLHLGATSPAYQIIDNAKFLEALPTSTARIGDTEPQALTKLMKSFYDYGRLHWTWSSSTSANSADGGLVKGLVTSVACGGFNANFRWLAEGILGIKNLSLGQYTGSFLTKHSIRSIDTQWVGNVSTSTKNIAALGCYKFTNHYWVKHNGINYDVCYNNTFANESQIIWSKLEKVAVEGTAAALYRVSSPIPEGNYLKMSTQAGEYVHGWPTWYLFKTI